MLSFHPADMSFIKFGKEFGSPIPLRRTLSLMRKAECKSIVMQKGDLSEGCDEAVCGTRYKSCVDYVNNLQNYNYQIKSKKCYKLLFFNTNIDNEEELARVDDSNFLGFCIVHNDRIKNGEGKEYLNCYVTESCVQSPLKWNAYVLPPANASININGREFRLEANYFSQQNRITNCCAHAAIKMAIRGYYPHITAELINQNVPINHIDRKGNEGLTPDEICKAIGDLSDNGTYIISSTDLSSSSDFLRLVYLSLESRLPVILLFNLPREGIAVTRHAVTLIGHTFNEHNWSSYGLKGYFLGENLNFLHSSLWCDNLVINDDNLGPYYLVTIKFLTEAADLSYILLEVEKAVQKVMASSYPVPIRFGWPINPISAIIVYPKHMSFIKNGLLVEPWALANLNNYVSKLETDHDVIKGGAYYQYFRDFQKEGNLILRTFCVSKKEYLQFIDDNSLMADYRDKVAGYLPETFWLTEISIPELYWINRKKVGEIITDPEAFNNSMKDGVSLIRLPGLLGFLEKEEAITINIQEGKNYYDLITPTGLSQFRHV